MKRIVHCVVAMLLVLVVAGGSVAGAQESGWSTRLNLTFTDPDRRTIVESDGDEILPATGEALGLALSGEYRFSDRIGLEIGLQAGYEADVAVTIRDGMTGIENDGLTLPEDGLRFTIVDAALNIYFGSGGVDFYIGPVIGYVYYDDLRFEMGAPVVSIPVVVDGNVAFGGVLGMDVPCGDKGWFFTTSLKYLDTAYDARAAGSQTVEIDFDPLIVRAGFGYRY